MSLTWLSVGAFLIVAVAIAGGLWVAARLIAVRPKVASALRDEVYECGEPPAGPTRVQFQPRYYVVALVFVIFDVEAALLFPWAMQAKTLGLPVVIPGLIFIGVLMLGWLYALRKGALEWQ
jgi:NADH:ubiquinone oxidoreductase subunit 3 (subunit A)